jgi:phosphatidate cytidylyltransferase
VRNRIISTTALWVLVWLDLRYLHTAGAVALVVLMAVLTLREFYQLQAAAGRAPFARLGMLFGGLIVAAPWLSVRFGWDESRLVPIAVLIFCIRILGERKPEQRVDSLASSLFGLVFVAMLFQYYVRLVTPVPGDPLGATTRQILCVWIVAAAKFCDTGALLGGMIAGRHSLAPTISPKKTWEGAVAGVLVSMVVGGLPTARIRAPPFPESAESST